jgi:MYXO-CTERM domain-containing protein
MEYGVPDIIPTPPYDSFLSPGMDISLAGYGVIGDGLHGAWDGIAGEALWAATNRVESVLFGSSEFMMDLDAPGSGEATVLEGIAAPGDSGGPAFLCTSDGWRVCGLTSRGQEDLEYGTFMISTQVAPYLDSFVVAAMSEWGEPPLYIPSPSAFGLAALGVAGVARRRLRDALSIQDRNKCS